MIGRRLLLTLAALLLMATPALAEYPDDCLGVDGPSGTDCADITDIGCCDDLGRVIWCEGGELYCIDCPELGPQCGWQSDAGFYNCGTDGEADPSGDNPIDCIAGCDPECGEGQLCIEGECCTPNCTDKTCGDDGCGGSCGDCGAGTFCNDSSVCEDLPVCQPVETIACDAVVEGTTVGAADQLNGYSCKNWDESGPEVGYQFDVDYLPDGVTTDNVTVAIEFEGAGDLDLFILEEKCTVDSCIEGHSSEAEAEVTAGGTYFFVVDGFGEAEGAFTMKVLCLSTCEASCDGGPCSDDGCKGVCPCETEGDVCFDGDCCTPSCDGKECGSDGCGGSCASCEPGMSCEDGVCVEYSGPEECLGASEPSGTDCMDLTYEGCCDHLGRLMWCEEGALYCIDCAGGGNDYCGWQDPFYNCGTDGTADPSGVFPKDCVPCDPPCLAGEICVDGSCEECIPDCTDKECGGDGCGSTCGQCDDGAVCNAGACEFFSCAGSCGGASPFGCYCDADCFQYQDCCEDICIECPEIDGCVADCDPPCAAGEVCEGGVCVACEPECAGKACGEDGCGGSCGECPGGSCAEGVCYIGPGCAPLEIPGCDDCPCEVCVCEVDAYCCDTTYDQLCADICISQCGACSGGPVEGCGDGNCTAPENCETCPADCGCELGLTCDAGACVEGDCTPDCTGKECGDDGCSGTCGDCVEGKECGEGICVPGALTDVIGGDVPAGTDNDFTSEEPTNEKSGCTTGANGNPFALMLFLSMLLAIVAIRRVNA
jgi:hypothetical protein